MLQTMLLLPLFWISLVSYQPKCSAALPACQPVVQGGRYSIEEDCIWTEQLQLPSQQVLVEAAAAAANLPTLNLAPEAKPGPAAGLCAPIAQYAAAST
jgi:hypothetical protein